MIDIDAEFRKAMGVATTANQSTSDEPLTIEKLRAAARLLGPPPPEVRLSKHVPALGKVRPSARPLTDDMRKMVEDIGEQIGPTAWCIKGDFGDVYFINPVNVKEGQADG